MGVGGGLHMGAGFIFGGVYANVVASENSMYVILALVRLFACTHVHMHQRILQPPNGQFGVYRFSK